MLYAIIGHAANPTAALARRAEVRPAHLARVEALQAAGRLIIAGPFPAIDSPEPGPAGYAGLLIIAEFRSQAWAADDPYVTEGVVDQVEVKPYIRVLP